jgi:hypothetical protein
MDEVTASVTRSATRPRVVPARQGIAGTQVSLRVEAATLVGEVGRPCLVPGLAVSPMADTSYRLPDQVFAMSGMKPPQMPVVGERSLTAAEGRLAEDRLSPGASTGEQQPPKLVPDGRQADLVAGQFVE